MSEWGEGLAEVFGCRYAWVLRQLEGTRYLIRPRISGLRLMSLEGPWMMCVWAVPSTCLPSPCPGHHVSSLHAWEPELEALALQLL